MANNRRWIDQIARSSGFGRTFAPMTDLYYGIDHRHSGSSYQKNNDHFGLTLFTRPMMNLSYNNVVHDRVLMNLLDQNPNSIYRAIRVMLDTELQDETAEGTGLQSKLVDNKQAFMPLLTNTLESISGFPDITVDTYTAPEGIRKEAWSMVDGVAEANETYDLTANFLNVAGDPITMLFHAWVTYAGAVYAGDMSPRVDHIINNEIDYQTRIWRLVLDKNKRYVKKIGCANAAFPMASPLGAAFNYSTETPYNEENDQISIPFRCMGAEYMDPILYNEFNLTVARRNKPMSTLERRRETYVKLQQNEIDTFNFNGYPWINLDTMELEWWVDKQTYEEMQNNDIRNQLALNRELYNPNDLPNTYEPIRTNQSFEARITDQVNNGGNNNV